MQCQNNEGDASQSLIKEIIKVMETKVYSDEVRAEMTFFLVNQILKLRELEKKYFFERNFSAANKIHDRILEFMEIGRDFCF